MKYAYPLHYFLTTCFCFFTTFILLNAEQKKLQTTPFDPVEVKLLMKKVANWQIFHFQDRFSKNQMHHPLHWANEALYTGMTRWAKISGDDHYYKWLRGIGDS